MSARTSAAARTPKPVVSTPTAASALWRSGQRTKSPHMPYTTLGIAASRSSACASGRPSHGGAAFTKSAAANASGTATTSARPVVTSVPTTAPAAPNEPPAGFQSSERRKRRPCALQRSADAHTSATARAIARRSPSAAPERHRPLKSASVENPLVFIAAQYALSRLEADAKTVRISFAKTPGRPPAARSRPGEGPRHSYRMVQNCQRRRSARCSSLSESS